MKNIEKIRIYSEYILTFHAINSILYYCRLECYRKAYRRVADDAEIDKPYGADTAFQKHQSFADLPAVSAGMHL